MRGRPLLPGALLLGATMTAASPSIADDPAAPAAEAAAAEAAAAEAVAAEADALFHKAGLAYDAGDFAAARSLYEAAFGKKKTHDIAAMLAQTELKLGRPCEADAHLTWAIAHYPPSLPDERRQRLLKARADVKKRIGALRVETSPAGAAVQVDFRPVDASALPGPFCVAAGERCIFVSLDGFAVERRILPVDPGEVVTVNVELRRVAPIAASAAPALPSARPPAIPGTPPPASWSTSTGLAAAGLVVGGIALGVGIVAVGPLRDDARRRGDALAGSLGNTCPSRSEDGNDALGSGAGGARELCRPLWSARDREAALGNAGIWSMLLGASMSAVAGGFLLFLPPARGAQPGGPRVTVGAAPDGAFVALKGAF